MEIEILVSPFPTKPEAGLPEEIERWVEGGTLLLLSLRLTALAATGSRPEDFWTKALWILERELQVEQSRLMVWQHGAWQAFPDGAGGQPESDLLAEVLDEERPQQRGAWWAVPLLPPGGENRVLALRGTPRPPSGKGVREFLLELGAGLQCVAGFAETALRRTERITRLATLLELSRKWNQTSEMEPLLVAVAEAATKLLDADRATIFLWDRESHTLVGRPALGVTGNELRIPDETGIVGQVIHTREPRRADREEASQEIDRSVDEAVGYETQSVLCVPMFAADGELYGAFQVLNQRSGRFDDEDEVALAEIAQQAAVVLQNTEQRERLARANQQWSEASASGVRLIGDSPAIRSLQSTLERVAQTDLAVLVLGENGTGKEVVSRAIHLQSPRRDAPFVAVNCAAIADTLLESELFGHEKGAFTDAHQARAGKFELAADGTLFLDEIGDMSPGGQAKLLRVLEEKVVVRVGGSNPIHTDTRVIAATNQNLAELVREKKFREDLFFRLNVVTLQLPPLRERGDDVLVLAEYFLNDFCRKARRETLEISTAAQQRLRDHRWPGNVRELRNLMEQLAFLLPQGPIKAEDLNFIATLSRSQEDTPGVELGLPLTDATLRFQTEYIERTVTESGGNMTEVARRLGLHRSNLYRKMRQLGMNELP